MAISKFKIEIILLSFVFIIGLVYVTFSISPSHYSVVLEQYLGLDSKPIAGEAKLVRGDEYSVVTPYFQIAVNNNFQRYNQLSPYKEDLRFFYGLPLADWALAFKPYMWGFWVLDAARAYSLYHYFMIAMFLVGYTLFFRALKLPIIFSSLLAGILFFSQHNQAWWSTNAPVFALTVWIVLPFLFDWPRHIKFFTTFYISLMALLALIYPPWQITLIYMFGVFALAFRKEKFRLPNILISLSAFLLAGCVYYLYQQDSISLMLNTVYPGERSLSGGYLPRYYLWAFFAPHSLINTEFYAISDIRNMCEIAIVGSLLIPSVFCFSNFKSLFKIIRDHLWSYSLIIGFIFVLFSWMYLPVPASIGKFILFDQINVLRILLTFGSSSIILSAIIAYKQQWNFSWFRFFVFALLTLSPPFFAYLHIKKETIQSNTINLNILDTYDYLTLIPLLSISIVLLYHWLRRNRNNLIPDNRNKQIAYTLLTTALLFNVVSFAHFNPLQSAKDIFSKELQETVTSFKAKLKLDEGETILYQSHLPYLQTGSILNGLNIPSLNHALLIPQLDFYKELFPDTNPDTFNQALNRYAKIQFSNQYIEPKAIHFDVVGLPMEVAAQQIDVGFSKESNAQNKVASIEDSDCQNCITNTIFPHELRWGKPQNDTRILSLNFTSPFIIDDKNSIIEINTSDDELIDDMNLSAKFVAEVNIPWYFSEGALDIVDISKWNLYIRFGSDDNDQRLLKKLSSSIDSIMVKDLEGSQFALIQLQKDLKVEEISEQNFTSHYQVQPKGYIDIANYDSNSGRLSLEGWTPVEDTQSARWIGYKSDLDIQVLESKTILRPRVSSDFGENLYKGFKIILKIPPQENDMSVPLCLYSSTRDLGTYTIYNENIPFLKCSIEAQFESIPIPKTAPQMNGMIDHARLSEDNKTLVLTGWASKKQLDDFSLSRWFGYSGLIVDSYDSSAQSRPDVAKIFGDDYAMSGFQLTLNFSNVLESNKPIDLCLYSRSDTMGQFFIPYSTNQNIFYCRFQK